MNGTIRWHPTLEALGFSMRVKYTKTKLLTPVMHSLQIAKFESLLIDRILSGNHDPACSFLDPLQCSTLISRNSRVPHRGSIFCCWTNKTIVDCYKIICWQIEVFEESTCATYNWLSWALGKYGYSFIYKNSLQCSEHIEVKIF